MIYLNQNVNDRIELPWVIIYNGESIAVNTNDALIAWNRNLVSLLQQRNPDISNLQEFSDAYVRIEEQIGVLPSRYRALNSALRRRLRYQQGSADLVQPDPQQHNIGEVSFDPHQCHAFCFCTGKH